MNLFLILLLGHLLGDFLLQTNWIYRFKTQSWVGIALHTGIHIVVTLLLVKNWVEAWPLILLLGVIHFCIDWSDLYINLQVL